MFGPKRLSLPSNFWLKGNEEEIDINDLECNKKSNEIVQNECIIIEVQNPIEILNMVI